VSIDSAREVEMQRVWRAAAGIAFAMVLGSCGSPEPESEGATSSSRPLSSPPVVLDGLSQAANSTMGSSDPTYLPTNHRLALTAAGRLLLVFGLHEEGIQLAWREPHTGWRTSTRGDVTDGRVLSGTGTGDWPASIIVHQTEDGHELAWIVWGPPDLASGFGIAMRQLSGLDDPNGPRLGPLVQLAGRGSARPDLAVTGEGKTLRGTVTWLQESESGRRHLVAAPVLGMQGPTPTLGEVTVLDDSGPERPAGTLVVVDGRPAAAVRGGDGVLRVLREDDDDGWRASAAGPIAHGQSQPTAVSLSDGSVLVAVEVSPDGGLALPSSGTATLSVLRFPADGAAPAEALRIDGYVQPTMATDGSRAWLVAVRQSDGLVVSRQLNPSSGWSPDDVVEVDESGGGNNVWPNALRAVDGRLRVAVEGPASSPGRSSVLVFQREV
jgi:hypothetical protein